MHFDRLCLKLAALLFGTTLGEGLAETLPEASDHRHLIFLISHNVFLEVDPLEPCRRQEGLDQDALNPREHADADTQQVLLGGQR